MSMGFPIEELEKRIGYSFQNKNLLKQALTHSSYANEQKIRKNGDYERLEFLGDAVLEMVTSEFLYREYPDTPEGKLTKMRSSMVCEPALAYCARELELEKYLFLGKGEENTGGRKRESIISDVMEAVIGAIYLDGGLKAARNHIETVILSDMDHKKLFYDSKTVLQEMIQKKQGQMLEYRLIHESGPDHDKLFRVQAVLNGSVVGTGEGRTKKAAQQQAAYEVILLLRQQEREEAYVSKKY